MRRTHGKAVIAALVAALVLGAIIAFITLGVPFSKRQLQRQVESAISDALDADVALGDLNVSIWPRLAVSASDLHIRHKKRPDVDLIAVKSFTLKGTVGGLLRRSIDEADVVGLAITIPRVERPQAGEAPPRPRSKAFGKALDKVQIGLLVADGSSLTVLPRNPEGRSKVWSMQTLRLHEVRVDRAIPFDTVLTNAIPPGEIVTHGSFGPWDAQSPGSTPIEGQFTFDHADLSVFKGISGMLRARGSYTGSLDRISVAGQTTMPDFALTVGGNPVKLDTQYQAVVDATNGDTILNRVDAQFGHTALVASGGVVNVKHGPGRELVLDVSMKNGRLEDVLPLAVDGPKPTMLGALALDAHLELPPGEPDVIDRLRLKGNLRIKDGTFTDPGVQGKLRSLSLRASKDDESVPGTVRSDFYGRFDLGRATLRLDPLNFDVPGALVEIKGRYGVRDGALAFAGQLWMDAKLSNAVGGWKALLLKPFDPLFRKDGRTFIPITISGARARPSFGLDRQRLFDKDKPIAVPK
ncbi:MAG: AsmA-like C-terminal region-containing protein [Vicinamibacterales bacterium]